MRGFFIRHTSPTFAFFICTHGRKIDTSVIAYLFAASSVLIIMWRGCPCNFYTNLLEWRVAYTLVCFLGWLRNQRHALFFSPLLRKEMLSKKCRIAPFLLLLIYIPSISFSPCLCECDVIIEPCQTSLEYGYCFSSC